MSRSTSANTGVPPASVMRFTVETQVDGSEVGVLALGSLTVRADVEVQVEGARPMVLLVGGDAFVAGVIDAGGRLTEGGPGGHAGGAPGEPGAGPCGRGPLYRRRSAEDGRPPMRTTGRSDERPRLPSDELSKPRSDRRA